LVGEGVRRAALVVGASHAEYIKKLRDEVLQLLDSLEAGRYEDAFCIARPTALYNMLGGQGAAAD
jgi:hypothetical protein